MIVKGRSRLDRRVSKIAAVPLREVRQLVARKRVLVDGVLAIAANQTVDQFSQIQIDGECLPHDTALYFMLNKPAGVVSATKDADHRTVIDLIDHTRRGDLHIVGRLDFNSTGLLLLSNDGHWSRRLSLPGSFLPKVYRVKLQHPVSDACIQAFKVGMHFAYENITTLPAEISRLASNEVEVVLREGKYHQIKRMFGRFDNRVLTLHRLAVGSLQLDSFLRLGDFRTLSESELGGLRRDIQETKEVG